MEGYLYLQGVHPSKEVTMTFTLERSQAKQHEGQSQIYTISSKVDQNLVLDYLSCSNNRAGWDSMVHEHSWRKKIFVSG